MLASEKWLLLLTVVMGRVHGLRGQDFFLCYSLIIIKIVTTRGHVTFLGISCWLSVLLTDFPQLQLATDATPRSAWKLLEHTLLG